MLRAVSISGRQSSGAGASNAGSAAYKQHEHMMAHWHDVCPIPIHTVHYEDLVNDPEPHVRAMLNYIGLDWEPACLEPERVERSINTASVWQARQPIYTGSVEKWRSVGRLICSPVVTDSGSIR